METITWFMTELKARIIGTDVAHWMDETKEVVNVLFWRFSLLNEGKEENPLGLEIEKKCWRLEEK